MKYFVIFKLFNYKTMKNKMKLLGLTMMITVLTFVAIGAQAISLDKKTDIEERKSAVEERRNEKVCSRIDDVLTRLEKKIGKKNGEDKLKERVQIRTKEMEENRAKRDADLSERREVRDQNRDVFYDKLKAKAGEDSAKKAAVEKFKTAVETAIKTRREAIDSAKKTMNAGIDRAIATRETSVETFRNEFRSSVETAIDKAKSSCENGASGEELKSVMTQLKNDIKTARENYKAKVSEVKKVQESIQTLREVRKESVKLAIENFKTTMKAAQEELRKAMGA
ncbi:MAG TPA: hypothetical protein DDY52_04700 [Candidatus Moranbacteria bacterium]|nr:MAG: surface antigen [Candidatus Moranbacteria bacterium GW2011_GWF1_34_10]HBI17411.1 hypothetical protein [Candidatus Moranbacteria bacterium]